MAVYLVKHEDGDDLIVEARNFTDCIRIAKAYLEEEFGEDYHDWSPESVHCISEDDVIREGMQEASQPKDYSAADVSGV